MVHDYLPPVGQQPQAQYPLFENSFSNGARAEVSHTERQIPSGGKHHLFLAIEYPQSRTDLYDWEELWSELDPFCGTSRATADDRSNVAATVATACTFYPTGGLIPETTANAVQPKQKTEEDEALVSDFYHSHVLHVIERSIRR